MPRWPEDINSVIWFRTFFCFLSDLENFQGYQLTITYFLNHLETLEFSNTCSNLILSTHSQYIAVNYPLNTFSFGVIN